MQVEYAVISSDGSPRPDYELQQCGQLIQLVGSRVSSLPATRKDQLRFWATVKTYPGAEGAVEVGSGRHCRDGAMTCTCEEECQVPNNHRGGSATRWSYEQLASLPWILARMDVIAPINRVRIVRHGADRVECSDSTHIVPYLSPWCDRRSMSLPCESDESEPAVPFSSATTDEVYQSTGRRRICI